MTSGILVILCLHITIGNQEIHIRIQDAFFLCFCTCIFLWELLNQILPDLNALTQSMRETDKQIKEENAALVEMMKELTFRDDATKEAVEAFIRVLEEV